MLFAAFSVGCAGGPRKVTLSQVSTGYETNEPSVDGQSLQHVRISYTGKIRTFHMGWVYKMARVPSISAMRAIIGGIKPRTAHDEDHIGHSRSPIRACLRLDARRAQRHRLPIRREPLQ